MLTQMRGFTRGWMAYLLLFVLTVAFAIWGINDVFNGVGSQNLAEVSGRNITPPQLSRELSLTLRSERQNGNNMSQQEAVDAGVHLQLLESMIGRHALSGYAERLGVSVSDTMVAERIRSIPAVMNPVTNSFDETAYDQFLQQLEYTRPEFENDIRGDMTREMLLESLVVGVRAPSSFGAMALTYQTETRVVSIAEAPASAAGAIPPPNDAQLRTFYEESQEQLRVPEFRAVTLVYARPQDFVARVDVPEARLREEFETRRASLTQPERRSYVRISAQNEAQANDIVARLGRGQTPDAIASALSAQVQRGENQARTDVPDANVAEAVFSGARGSSRAVRGSLAPWVVVRVDSITAPVAPDFTALRDELRQAIANDEAATMLGDAVREFEDSRSGGVSIADAARQHGFSVVTIPAIEAGGRNRAGAPVEALAGEEHQELLRTAFQTPEGEASDFIPAGDADVIVSVDSVTPVSVQPFDDVSDQLRAAWIGRERIRRLRELGEEVTEAVRGGQTFAAAARARGFSIAVQSRALDRQMAAQIPARGLASQIFALRQGDLANEIRADGGAMLVAQVEQINRVNPADEPQAVEAARAAATQNMIQSVATTLQDEIVRRARPQRNEQLLNRLFQRTGEGAEGEEEPQ